MSKNEYIVTIDVDECVQCGGCMADCPVNALQAGAGGYPYCVESVCVRCGLCIETCPVMAISYE